MAAFCARHGYSGRTSPEIADRKAPGPPTRRVTRHDRGQGLRQLLFTDQLELLNRQLRAITKRIRELLAGHPDAAMFLSFPGMGTGHRRDHAR